MVSEGNDAVPPKLSTTTASGGLIISTTDAISTASLTVHSTVPYTSLRAIWFGSERETRPSLLSLLAGCDFILTSPKPRKKSEELKVRLQKLEEAAERKAYQDLVKDITPRKGVEEPFSSYKDRLGFGLHVVVTMFTGYLVGYAAFRALFSHSPAMCCWRPGGILGLVGAMLVETLLFILRSSDLDRKSSSSSTSPSTNLKIKKNQ